MNRIFFRITFFCFLSIFASGQQSKEAGYVKMNADLAFLKAVLYEAHPAAFQYISRDSLDGLFAEMAFDSSEKVSILELKKRVRVLLNRVGCVHTSITGSVFEADEGMTMPFDVFAKGNRIWIKEDLADSSSSLIGSRLLAINGHDAQTMINEMKNYHSSDGYRSTLMDALINSNNWFSHLYQYYFDADSVRTYQLLTNDADTLVIRRANIKVVAKTTTNDSQWIKYDSNVSLRLDTAHAIAILKIRSFSKGPILGTKINKHHYKKAMVYAQKNGCENLVIDLRGNLGGDATSGNALASFFIKEPHQFTSKRHEAKIWKYAVLKSKFGVIINFLFGDLFASRRPTFKNGISISRIRSNPGQFSFKKLFVLTDGFTASTASNTASLFKYNTDAIMVGSETAGGESALNAFFFPVIKLPNSKIKIQIPQYHINLNIVQNKGRGVIPDVPVDYTIQDVLSGSDLEMNAVIKVIE